MAGYTDSRTKGRRRRREQNTQLRPAASLPIAREPDQERTDGDPGGQDRQLHLVFKALADPTRRRILDLIKHRPLTTHALCEEFRDLTRFAVMKHLKVLEQANLVVVRRSGRERYNYLNHIPIRMVYERWMGPYAELWSSSLLRLKDHVERNAGSEER